MSAPRMVRTLVLTQVPGRPWQFIAILDGQTLAQSDQPVVDAARELLRRGADPDQMLTARHYGSDHDAFRLQPIGEWARLTYTESRRDGLRRQIYRPYSPALPTGDGKSGVSDAAEAPDTP